MADIGKIYNLAARFYLARKDSETGGVKNTFTAKNTTGGLGGIAKNFGINMATNALMGKLGLAALGPLGMLLSPFISRFIGNKFSGLGLNPGGGGGGGGKPNFPTLTKKQIYDRDDVDPADQGFEVTGQYDGKDFYSAEGTTVDKDGSMTKADGTYAGNIYDEFKQPAPTTPTQTYYDDGGDNSDGESGGGGGGLSSNETNSAGHSYDEAGIG